MKNRNVFKMVVALMVLFVVPQMVMARGVQDSNGQNENPFIEKYEEIVAELEAGEITGPEAKALLNRFRESLKYENQEQYKLMESCIEAIENGEMTKTEACERVAAMEKLRERDQIREKVQEHDGTGEQEQIMTEEQTRANDGEDSGQSKKGK